MPPASAGMRFPVTILAGGATVTLALVGAIIIASQQNVHTTGASGPVNVTYTFSAPPPSPPVMQHERHHRSHTQRSKGNRDEAFALSASKPTDEQPVETTDACGKCKGRCQLFDSSSPICCTSQCNRHCPILMASLGCEKTVEEPNRGSSHDSECEHCQQVCQYAGSACCMSA